MTYPLTWHRVGGDINDTLTVDLAGVANLDAAASIAAHVKNGATVATLAAARVPTTDNVVVQLGDAAGWLATAAYPTGSTGTVAWSMEIEVTFGSGAVLTWPEDGTAAINVRAPLG